jgi:biotin transport system permease protein
MLTLTYPHKTWAHRLPAGAKLAALAAASAALFATETTALLAIALLGAALLVASGGAGFAQTLLRALAKLWPFIAVVALWHIWLSDLAGGLGIILRMVTAVALANFVTMTTQLADMIAVLEWVLWPLRALIPPARLALGVGLMLRFIPVLLQRADTLAEAWRARSPARPRWHILPPLALSALDDSDRLAEAMRARGGIE